MERRYSKRILLADDSAEYRRSVISFVELEGYVVAEAASPQQAIRMLEAGGFQLVLADLRMRDDRNTNDVSGLEVARFASGHGIPCILVTAFPTVELARIALRARGTGPLAQDLITKSSDPQALLDSIHFTLATPNLPPREPMPEGIYIDLVRKMVFREGVDVGVSAKQFKLLEALWLREGGVCTYVELFKAVYGEDLSENESLRDTRIKKLVDRIKENLSDQDRAHPYIVTEFSRGYRLDRNPK
jgi:DNA-binding response OmpR family regulator